MISKTKLKHIKSLQVKKYRKQEQSFLVEGAKGVTELLKSSFEVEMVLATQDFIDRNTVPLRGEVVIVNEADLLQTGTFQSNDAAVAVARMRPNTKPDPTPGEFVIALDDIRDPGNLGTIIRTADWYGLRHIVASPETADMYNPKVISATMGSFTRVNVFYTDLKTYIAESALPVYGAFMEGESIYHTVFSSGGLIVIGNEANGISADVEAMVTSRIAIPRRGNAESLNAAVATAIILDNVVRRA